MNTYWLYLESYTMVFSETSQTLIYNTLSGEHLFIPKSSEVNNLLQRLILPPDIYLLQITEEELSNEVIKSFVWELRHKFMGELIDCRLTTDKPVILYPQLQLMASVKNLKLNDEDSIGDNILDYLQKITIQLTGNCNLSCPTCEYAYKQHIVCHKQKEELAIEQVQNIILHAKNSPVNTIETTGGNPFLYTKFIEFCHLLSTTPSLHFNIYCHPAHLSTVTKDTWAFLNAQSNITLKIQCPDESSIDLLKKNLSFIRSLQIEKSFDFMVLSEEHYEQIESICQTSHIDKYDIKLLLNEDNKKELSEALFLSPEDILSRISSRKDIFRRQSLNTFDFGNCTVLSNGDVYANLNFNKLGNIYKEDLRALLTKELEKGNSWLRIRNQFPCNNCVYQWLCPSPTNYELAASKPNLCTVKP